LDIVYPLDETVFPPDLAPPTFRWKARGIEGFTIEIGPAKGTPSITAKTTKSEWTPSAKQWTDVRSISKEKSVVFAVEARSSAKTKIPPLRASVEFSTSSHEVGAPLFYREVNLPFIRAIRDPSKIRWRFGPISSTEPPPIVLENLPVCGNCHSFSGDGSVLGMDIDYANDKGSYIITRVTEEIQLDQPHIITWSDYQSEDGEMTFGLLSRVSPDGRYAISTVKDRSVFVPMPDLAFSQLFFPVKGILVAYDTIEKAYSSLPGADDPEFVQSNPTWSPDGEHIVFVKSRAVQLKNVGKSVLLRPEDVQQYIKREELFRYDLYRIPWNGGKGGRAEPIEGASKNGMSNYFARYSPDGRWIVFCKSKSFMLLQEDSELYIMPAAGGEPRRMRCNTDHMNSWHSWSPNGRWLVFSSKPDGPYTQMMLTHIDDEGRSSPPVVLDRLVAPKRAANIPEFVNVEPGAIKAMHARFMNEYSFFRAGTEAMDFGTVAEAERAFRKSLAINPEHADTLNNLGFLLMENRRTDEARELFERAVKSQPNHIKANNHLSRILLEAGEFARVDALLSRFVKLRPDNAVALCNLGTAKVRLGQPDDAQYYWERALQLDPDFARAHCNLGTFFMNAREDAMARHHLEECRRLRSLQGAEGNL